MEESINFPWDQAPNEPDESYRWFKDYFLAMGIRRSLRGAYDAYMKVEHTAREGVRADGGRHSAPSHWSKVSSQWAWRERAEAYDNYHLQDAQIIVEATLARLRENASRAVDALVLALENPRTQVQAANSILNRIGVPESTQVALTRVNVIDADEMAVVTKELGDWTQSQQAQLPEPELSNS